MCYVYLIYKLISMYSSFLIITDLTVAESISCFLHSLQLVLHDAIFVQRKIVDIIAKCRKIVSHFNHSSSLHKIKNNSRKFKTFDS